MTVFGKLYVSDLLDNTSTYTPRSKIST